MWSTPVLVIAVTLLIIIYKKISKSREYWKHISEIPGPKGKPIVGNLFDFLTTSEQLFLNRRKWAKEFGSIYKTTVLNSAGVAISSPEDVEKIINVKTHERKGMVYHAMKNWLGDGLIVSHGEKWKLRRKILTPAFHFSILRDFADVFNREVEDLLDYLTKHCNEPYIDVTKPITEYTLCSIIETSMGIRLNEQKSGEVYKKAITGICESVIRRVGSPWLMVDAIYAFSDAYKVEKSHLKILHDFSDSVIAERKKTLDSNHNSYSDTDKKKALLDLLLSEQLKGTKIDDAGIREEVDTFLFAGHDTTGVTICHTLVALANNKQIQDSLYKEICDVLGDSTDPPTYSDIQNMPLMDRCVKETLRLYTSVPMINRLAEEDIKTHSGYTIPKGTNIFIFIMDMHRNPELWENPLEYNPDRFLPENVAKRHPFSFIPFSAGTRNCIGQKYGLLKTKIAVCGILRKFRLEPVDSIDTLTFKADIVLRSTKQIRVKFIPRI